MSKLLLTAISAALDAGAEIIKVYASDFKTEYKTDNSPLTVADKNANKIINSYLQKTEIPIISEENEQLDYSIRKKWNSFWMVDPLDGTKEFVNRNGEFTVNIALISEGIPVLGVIYVPVSKTLYYGDLKRKKSYKVILNNHNFEISEVFNEKHEIKPFKGNSNEVKVVGSRSHFNTDTKNYIQKLEEKGLNVDLVSKGSSLKFCLVAEGAAQVYPRFAPTMEWDTAAGHAICKAVGMNVKIKGESRELQYNKENLLNPYFIVN